MPEACRNVEHAKAYPLPTKMVDLQRLVAIPVPDMNSGPANDGDSATKIYLERASLNLRVRRRRRDSAYLDLTRRQQSITEMQSRVKAQMNVLKEEAKQAVEGVKAQAQEAIASLNDLFALGRQCIDGQMRAHLNGAEWKGEYINASAARACFRMVSMAVKGLGLPSEQRQTATRAVMDQIAESIKATQDALTSGPGDEDETAH
jgi:hypothetical protein